jgi:hypothetical protein
MLNPKPPVTMMVAIFTVGNLCGCPATAPLSPPAVNVVDVPSPQTPAVAPKSDPAVTPVQDTSKYADLRGHASFLGNAFADANVSLEDALNSTPVAVLAAGDAPPAAGIYVKGASMYTDANGNFDVKVANLPPRSAS